MKNIVLVLGLLLASCAAQQKPVCIMAQPEYVKTMEMVTDVWAQSKPLLIAAAQEQLKANGYSDIVAVSFKERGIVLSADQTAAFLTIEVYVDSRVAVNRQHLGTGYIIMSSVNSKWEVRGFVQQ